MDTLSSFALLLLGTGVFLYLLFFVVRTAVREGVQTALRTDLLDPRALGGGETTEPGRGA